MYTFKELYMWKVRGERPLKAYINRGMRVGRNFYAGPGCSFDYDHCWLITMGDNVGFAPGVMLLAHDAFTAREFGYVRIGNVNIEDNVYIGSNAIILPGVTIGRNSIIGANAVVTKDIPEGVVAVGNPAKVVGTYEKYLERNKKLMEEGRIFEEDYTIRGNITEEKKKEMHEKLKEGIGFIR